MKTKLLFLTVIALVGFSCEQVIDLKLKESDSQYVIKGVVVEGDSSHVVTISKSIPFDQNNIFPGVTGATLTLTDNLGNSTTLNDLGDGKYAAQNYPAIAGRTYTLSVNHDGNTFTASSFLPSKVPLQGVEFLPNQFFGETGFIIVPKFQDPAGIANFYTFRYSLVNDPSKETGRLIRDDENTDGQVNEQPLFDGFNLQSKDTVTLTMTGISREVYKFYTSKSINTSGNSGAPANPVSNWSNNALGYFSAQNEQTIVFIVP